MRIDYTDEQKAVRDEIRAYFADLMTPDVVSKLGALEGGDLYRGLIKQMAKDGWLGIGWPKELGGQGRSWIEQQIFFDEARCAHAPIPFVTINTVGPALMQLGTEEQKKQFLANQREVESQKANKIKVDSMTREIKPLIDEANELAK